jgi:glycylpeptide N-tetradecanoyltransferase
MERKDLESAWKLLSSFVSQFAVAQTFTLADFETRYFEDSGFDTYKGVADRPHRQIYSYVVEDPASHEITDFVCCFYFLQRVIGSPKHEFITSLFVDVVVPNAKAGDGRAAELVDNVLLVASQEGFDQVECVNVMNAQAYLAPCGFRKGTGRMLYYLHNWLTGSPISQDQWGVLQL